MLLSCLGKDLERLIAKRMSHLAIVSDIVGHQHFVALSKRSVTDLVSCSVHDIEEAHTQGWVSTLVTLNVQRAFDVVLHSRLIQRMQAQGWPYSVLRWTTSLLKNRFVQVRYSEGISSLKELMCGMLQSSPVSPLLFLLYTGVRITGENSVTRKRVRVSPRLIELHLRPHMYHVIKKQNH